MYIGLFDLKLAYNKSLKIDNERFLSTRRSRRVTGIYSLRSFVSNLIIRVVIFIGLLNVLSMFLVARGNREFKNCRKFNRSLNICR